MPDAVSEAPSRRVQKQEATRRNLLEAAARQIGAEGYAGASVHKITTSANIANGTFYNYFTSQQDLFDQLLPEMGDYLIEQIRNAIHDETDSIKREELGFRAFFEYLARYPSFYRVLNEAETFAPQAYANHMDNMAAGYRRALHAAKQKGELLDFSERELEVIVYILLSARDYLAYRFTLQNGKAGRLPDWVVDAYMKFILGGVAGDGHGARAHRARSDRRSDEQRYAVETRGDGSALVTLTTADDSLGDFGTIARGGLAALIERAGIEAIGAAGERHFEMTSLATSFTRSSHARRLFARAERTALSEHLAHVTVNVFEDAEDGEVIATGLAVYTFAR